MNLVNRITKVMGEARQSGHEEMARELGLIASEVRRITECGYRVVDTNGAGQTIQNLDAALHRRSKQ